MYQIDQLNFDKVYNLSLVETVRRIVVIYICIPWTGIRPIQIGTIRYVVAAVLERNRRNRRYGHTSSYYYLNVRITYFDAYIQL